MQDIHPSVWIAPGAQIYGRVAIGEGSSVWPNVVIRCECEHVRIGRNTNIQDFTMIHVDPGDPTVIGDLCSITHRCVLHGCSAGPRNSAWLGQR